MTAQHYADLQEATRLVCDCGCTKCVSIVRQYSALGLAWRRNRSPCHYKDQV